MDKIYPNNGTPVSPVRARAAKILEDIIIEIAKEEGLTVKKVNTIMQSVFGTIAEDIRSGTLSGTHILHLGKFHVKPYNIQKYHDKHNNSN